MKVEREFDRRIVIDKYLKEIENVRNQYAKTNK
jgi:hypothetical protein